AEEGDDVAGFQREAAPGDGERDGATLAGEVLLGARRVRDAREAGAGRQLDALDRHAGERVGEELADGRGAPRPRRQRAGREELDGGARGGDELLDRDLQRLRRAVDDLQRRVGGARFEVRPGRARKPGGGGRLRLRQAARGAEVANVARDSVGEVLLIDVRTIGTVRSVWQT